MRELGEDVHRRMGTVGWWEVGDEVVELRVRASLSARASHVFLLCGLRLTWLPSLPVHHHHVHLPPPDPGSHLLSSSFDTYSSSTTSRIAVPIVGKYNLDSV